jgi:hypothetical protein
MSADQLFNPAAFEQIPGQMAFGGEERSGYVLDACHDHVQVGDVYIADYRGTPDQRFEVLEDDGTGLFRVRRPDAETSLMRPSTILNVAKRIERRS